MDRARMFSARRSRVAKTETNRSWSSALTLAKQRPRDAAMRVGGPSPTSLGHNATDRCAAYLSRFGGLWPDRCDGQNLLVDKLKHEAVSDFESEQLRAWMVNGYVKLVKAVSDEVIAELLGDADRFWHGSESRIRVEDGHLNYVAPTPALRDKPGCRLRDMYYFSEATRRAVFSPPIVRFLQLLFERDILAFQSLLFERGTQQGVHQDPAYVVVSSPLELVASWIALEDIQDDAGPLLYYEGSHRLPDFIFGERYKHWEVQRDGPAIEQEYRHSLEESARQRSLPLRRFVGARGDVLLWHANLAHGGATITNPDPKTTRRSLATHYCPSDVAPNYFASDEKHRAKLHWQGGCYYSSAFYVPSDQLAERTSPTAPWLGLTESARSALRRVKTTVKPFIPQPVRKLLRRVIPPKII